MPRLPNNVLEFLKKIPQEYTGIIKIIKKNYQRVNFDNLKPFDGTEIRTFYKEIIEEIFSPNSEVSILLKNLSVINTDVETNIDRKSVETSYELPNIVGIFDKIVNTGILIKKKKKKREIYKFISLQIQDFLEGLTDKESHEKALKYYEIKKKEYGDDFTDEIEILFHNTKLNPSEELVNQFLIAIHNITQVDYRFKRLVDVAETLMQLNDKYKAPILISLGNLFSSIGRTEEAEKIFLNALNIYKNLAKQYYRIYLPYVAATQKNLGTLYLDSKQFEEAEKNYLDALNAYKDLKKQYYDVHSPDFDLEEYEDLEKSYSVDLKMYNEALKKYYDVYLPEEPSFTNDLGNVCIDLDLLEDIQDGSLDSLDSYRKLAKMCYDMYLVDIAKTQSNLGLVYSELSKFEEAEKMHLKALKIKKKVAENYPDQVLPELVLTLIDLGDLYASLNKFEKAEKRYQNALKISKGLAEQNPDIYMYNVAIIANCLGNVYLRLQEFEEAEKNYLGALEIFNIYAKQDRKTYLYNVAEVQNNLGNLYMIIEDLEKAERYLNKALKADPTNSEIFYNIACLESLKNNHTNALELLGKVIKLDKAYIQRALSDNKFDNIRELKEFKELTGE
ncbi:MAG: tetratricopeptide repeat protein, partial [Promethearchaeota archaeon]